MKLDQETIVKHQFWFLLGGYFLLWFIAVLCLWFIAPGEINTLKTAYEGAATGVKSVSNPVNTATFLPPWEKEAKEFSDHKLTIWDAAWKWQAPMYDWPEEWRTKYDMTNPQTQIAADDRTDYKDKLYLTEIDSLRAAAPKWLNPVELKGGFDEVFKPMTKADWKTMPTREEIWLAQEDFWVKRELLFDVLKAMTWQAYMPAVAIDEKKEPLPKGVELRYRCKNKNWEITLLLRKSDKGLVIGHDSTIKNIHPSHLPQPLTSAKGKGIVFNVAQGNVRTMFEVRGEPVGWNETKDFSTEDYPNPLPAINWSASKKQPIYVSQGFDQTNSPIRRINAIELAKQDCRTFTWPLQPNHMLAQLDAPAEDPTKPAESAPSAGGGMTGGPPGGMSGGPSGMPGGSGSMMPSMPGMSGMPGMGGAVSAGNKTPNNEIERDRYLQPKDQDKKLNPPSRHLPLALELIVEQTHMNDLLVALANSRLRFQITQVEFHHATDYKPQSDSDKKGGADSTGDRTFSGGMPGMYGSMMGSGMQMMDMQRQRGQADQRDAMMRRQMQQQMMQSRGMMSAPPTSGGMTSGAMGSPVSRPRGGMPGGNYPTMPGGAMSDKSTSTPQDDNLVQLTIYGIATLYRAPDAPQTTGQPGQPGMPPTPTAPQPAAGTPAAPQAGQQTASPPPTGQQPAAPASNTGNTPPQANSPTPAPKQPDKPADPPKTPPAGGKS